MERKLIVLCCLLLSVSTLRAQWTVVDPTNLAQSIINSANEMIHTSTTAENMINNWKETVKIYKQSKEYYDRLRGVTETVKNARKIQRCILMVGEITDIYVTNYERMCADRHFTSRELSCIAFGYSRLLEWGADSLAELRQIVTPGDMSMSDKERLDIIERVHADLVRYRRLTEYYTRKSISVALLRAEEANDSQRTIALYGSDSDKYW